MMQKRAVIYCRVSRDDQSCDRQERDLTQFALSAGFKVLGINKEKISGTQLARVKAVEADVLAQVASGTSYRKVVSNLGIHKDTVGEIVKRSKRTN